MEVPLHSPKVTAWCTLTERTIIIGSFFFETPNGQTTTVNSERYGAILSEFFIPEFDNMNLVNHFFQQDGATSHTTRVNMSILRDRFPRQVISRFGDVELPARSPDLSLLIFPCGEILKAGSTVKIQQHYNNSKRLFRLKSG